MTFACRQSFPARRRSRRVSPSFPAGWVVEPDGRRVGVSLRTKDFMEAIRLFEALAEVAERLDHHPDLHLEGWNRVRIVTYSHDVGRLTERDEALAREAQHVLDRFGLRPQGQQG